MTANEIPSIGQDCESAAPVLTEAERHKLLVEWNRTERDYPRDKCVHQLFEEQVERSPEAVAVVFEGQTLTYRELNNRSNRLAHHLRQLGVAAGELVGLRLERSFEMVIAVLGILKVGGAYWAVEENLPEERLRLMLADARPRVVLVRRQAVKTLPGIVGITPADSAGHVITVAAIEDLLESSRGEVTPIAPSNQPSDPAYVSYTSGSTGKPKGVVVPHRGVVRLVKEVDYISLNAEQTLLHLSPLSFDASTFELWGALLNGGRVVLLPPGPSALEQIGEAIRQHGVTTLWLTAGLFHLMVDERLEDLKPLRQLLAGGDVLSPGHVRKAHRSLPGCRIVNGYGPTENTTFTCCYTVADEEELIPSVPIGRPIANTQVYVLDACLQPVPVGVAGELYAGGDGLACGYLHQPKLTSERFIADPFSRVPGARLYRTGDWVRWRADGNLEFLGRMDSQVKIRGFRVELVEIEAVLGGHPAVAACAVVALNAAGENKELTAFVVRRSLPGPTGESLRDWLREKLPEYMIPSRFVAVAALPLTPNGKVDRPALIKASGEKLVAGAVYVGPRNEWERMLMEIWQAVLGRHRVGVHDNFFDLGGHSLLAVRLCSQIIRGLHVKIPLRWVFEYPTIAALVKRMESIGGHPQNTCAIRKIDRQRSLAVSFAQQRMWLLQRLLPDPATYNQPMACRLSGPVDREKVRRTLQAILERHEVLRTALVQQGEKLVQQVAGAKAVPLPWQEMDLQAVPPSQKQAVLEERLLEEARRPFDLAQAPLWRAVWIELGRDEHVLGFTFHHSIVDEWSLRLFFQELERLYASDGQTERAGLRESPVQYADYAAWQRQRLTGEFLEQQRSYWMEQLRDLPPALELPTDGVRPPQLSGQGAIHEFHLSGSVVTQLRELARQERTTLFTVMLAAFQVWLHRYTGQTDVVVGTPITNRERPEIESMLGFFLNMLPIRARLDSNSSFRQVLRLVRESLLGAFSHADLPFETMVEMAVKERTLGHQPLYQVMFVLLEEGLPTLQLDQTKARLLPVETRTSKNDLTLSIEAVGEVWSFRFEYASDLFTAETVARMGGHLTELLRSITEDPEKSISQLDLMSEAERLRILVDWNQTEREYPRDKCVHQLFEEQVERSPEAVAVVFEGQTLSYRELNKRSNRLAHHLRRMGVETGDLVGLCLERSLDLVIAVYAVMKAGAAYLPIDPAYPANRVAFMLLDANPSVILTQEKLREKLPPTPGEVICLDRVREFMGRESVITPGVGVASGNLAYVIYTSGSTGQPKGVQVAHRSVVNLLLSAARTVGLTERDRLLAFTSISFDIAALELFLPLVTGGQLILASREVASDGTQLSKLIRSSSATIVQTTPATCRLLIEAGWQADPQLKVICGGEALNRSLADEICHRTREVWNFYGPTETTIWSTAWKVAPDEPISIGRPLANTEVYILDSCLQPVPVGIIGELYIGGDGLARGYLNRPELTAEKFIPHPYPKEASSRLYKTGDLGRYLPDGRIEYLGRADQQVKLRGYRIELAEIELVLRSQAGVKDAVVLMREDPSGEKRLVAYVVAGEGQILRVEELRQGLAQCLPDYMIPACFAVIPRVPLSANGKVDRRALTEIEGQRLASSTERIVPRTPRETQLALVWAKVLGLTEVGIHDNFFDLGGHSLLAVRLSVEVAAVLGRPLPVAAVFQSPTIESMARMLSATGQATLPQWTSLVPLQPDGSKPPFYFVHGWGGGPFGMGLARLLDADQPSYALQAVGWDGQRQRQACVEEMAAHYAREIRSLQPQGPYYLGGYSLGGWFAHATAQELKRQGQSVAMLALLDTHINMPVPWWVYWGVGGPHLVWSKGLLLVSRLLFHARQIKDMKGRSGWQYIAGRLVAVKNHFQQMQQTPVRLPVQTFTSPAAALPNQDYYTDVITNYKPTFYGGLVDLFIAEDAEAHQVPLLRHLLRGGINIHRISGTHLEMIRGDNLQFLSRVFGQALREAQARATPRGRESAVQAS